MIKLITINKKRVPVPVPVLDLRHLLQWISTTLLLPDHVITRVSLDGADVELSEDPARIPATKLLQTSRVDVQVDTPMDLTLQLIDATRNLTTVLLSCLKPMAVSFWGQQAQFKGAAQVDELEQDVQLLIGMIEQMVGLVVQCTNSSFGLHELQIAIQDSATAMQMAASSSDARGVSKMLLHRLEPSLLTLVEVCISAQSQVIQVKANQSSLRELPTRTPAKLA
jgi:hypothetical protein